MITTIEGTLHENKSMFQELLSECIAGYLTSPDGIGHVDINVQSRLAAEENWTQVRDSHEQGNDITQAVLDKLLPHSSSGGEQSSQVWVHAASPTANNLKKLYEANGWVDAGQWSEVATAIYQFINDCLEETDDLETAVLNFQNSGYSKGFASGMLSPILNALRPDRYAVINNKSADALYQFTNLYTHTSLISYPQANATAQVLLKEYSEILNHAEQFRIHPSDLFDLFTHWLSQNPEALAPMFSARAFWLLDQINQNPTQDIYAKHKDEIKEHVTEPIKRLMGSVKAHLPQQILEVMETEKSLFSNIYGQSGPQHNYWGAFYPKGSKRIIDAQLFTYLDHERFEFGFFLGRNFPNSLLDRFTTRCRHYRGQLSEHLKAVLDDPYFEWPYPEDDGVEEPLPELDDPWLDDPEAARGGVRLSLSLDEIEALPEVKLVHYVAQTFQTLFPLVLMTLEADPAEALEQYWRESVDGEREEIKGIGGIQPIYDLATMAEDLLIPEATLNQWKRAIDRKGQIIFYGPPGTSKTFVARHLARHLVSGSDGFWELMQFHPSYAYEDFMEGIRPRQLGRTLGDQVGVGGADRKPELHNTGFTYEMVPGRFLQFCEAARTRAGLCVLIIDEINRAELSRVFGELMFLLEYRPLSTGSSQMSDFSDIPLAGGTRFQIPSNVRLIGTMNTADRSIALVDHALRRRFAFAGMAPDYELLRRYNIRHNPKFPTETLIAWLEKVNAAIGDIHYALGVSFFLQKQLATHLEDIWCMEIEPYLEEFFFDKPERAEMFGWSKGPFVSTKGNLGTRAAIQIDQTIEKNTEVNVDTNGWSVDTDFDSPGSDDENES
ncbi:MAG TPA: AAA family ATPase [Abditibacteriaceae bacterium]|jgi:5-methylcytosine-specific restriction protein B